MNGDGEAVTAREARTERAMILTLLAIALLALYGLFADTARSAALARVTAANGDVAAVRIAPAAQ